MIRRQQISTVTSLLSVKKMFSKDVCLMRSIALTGLGFLFGVIATVSAVYAEDDGWELFYTNPTGDHFYYDPQSLSSQPAPGGQGPSNRISGVRYKAISGRKGPARMEMTQLVEFFCNKMLYRRLESEMTSGNRMIRSDRTTTPWMDILPGSSMETLFNTVCTRPPGSRLR